MAEIDKLGRARRKTQGGAGPKHLPDKTNARKSGPFDMVPPPGLGKEGLKMWEWSTTTLVKLGILDGADRMHLILFCETFQDYMDARADIGKTRILMDDHGNQKRHPAFTTLREKSSDLKSFYSDLGLNPSSRAKFGGSGEDNDDPFANIQANKGN